MTLSMYQASVPAFVQTLRALDTILSKATAYAEAGSFSGAVLLNARLYPDMLAFTQQVQIATDLAKGAAARLAGVSVPSYEDTELTFPELKERVTKTITFLSTVKPEQTDGSEQRDISLTIRGHEVSFKGQEYLLHLALPNFYFHATTAFVILRHNGLQIGKRDFLGMTSAS
jgi:hypothetical protein